MTTLKIAGRPLSAAMQALEPHVARLYDSPGKRIMAIIELAHMERLQVAPGSDKKPSVSMRITSCEVPNRDQEGAVREAQRALYLARTASGTLDEDGTVRLNERTLKSAAGLLMSIETARLRAGLDFWTEYARRVVTQSTTLTVTEMAHELQAVSDGLRSVLFTATAEDET